ncbi:MAG: hypothetical protein DRJ66_04215 [Thermoprotei archaeon]|mgnify:CR=1 FL=1|nr:MAG: hypothetical protein DRJ66_04215 [Thermoprotei archaeon]RLF19523.1 MAG: hypothetical protein DRZ82_05485 [Thermoprotei archaeon]
MDDEVLALLSNTIKTIRRAKEKLDMLYSDFVKLSTSEGRKLLFFEVINDIEEALHALDVIRRKLNEG